MKVGLYLQQPFVRCGCRSRTIIKPIESRQHHSLIERTINRDAIGVFVNVIVDSPRSTIKGRPRFKSALELYYVYSYRATLNGVENPLYRVIVDWKSFVLVILRLQRIVIEAPQGVLSAA